MMFMIYTLVSVRANKSEYGGGLIKIVWFSKISNVACYDVYASVRAEQT